MTEDCATRLQGKTSNQPESDPIHVGHERSSSQALPDTTVPSSQAGKELQHADAETATEQALSSEVCLATADLKMLCVMLSLELLLSKILEHVYCGHGKGLVHFGKALWHAAVLPVSLSSPAARLMVF